MWSHICVPVSSYVVCTWIANTQFYLQIRMWTHSECLPQVMRLSIHTEHVCPHGMCKGHMKAVFAQMWICMRIDVVISMCVHRKVCVGMHL